MNAWAWTRKFFAMKHSTSSLLVVAVSFCLLPVALANPPGDPFMQIGDMGGVLFSEDGLTVSYVFLDTGDVVWCDEDRNPRYDGVALSIWEISLLIQSTSPWPLKPQNTWEKEIAYLDVDITSKTDPSKTLNDHQRCSHSGYAPDPFRYPEHVGPERLMHWGPLWGALHPGGMKPTQTITKTTYFYLLPDWKPVLTDWNVATFHAVKDGPPDLKSYMKDLPPAMKDMLRKQMHNQPDVPPVLRDALED